MSAAQEAPALPGEVTEIWRGTVPLWGPVLCAVGQDERGAWFTFQWTVERWYEQPLTSIGDRTILRFYAESLTKQLANMTDRAEKAEAQLEAIDTINEDDWENGEAASWVYKIRNGLPLDGMETQEQLEDRYCAP